MVQNKDVVAEIAVTGSDREGYVWTMRTPTGDVIGDRWPTPTEAVWRAVDEIRGDDTASGCVIVFAADGERAAAVPLWAVPAYEHLPWEPTIEPIDLRRQTIDLEAALQGGQ